MDMKQSKRKNIRQERKKVGLVFPNIVLCVCARVRVCLFVKIRPCTQEQILLQAKQGTGGSFVVVYLTFITAG